jgi:hypothetical protein
MEIAFAEFDANTILQNEDEGSEDWISDPENPPILVFFCIFTGQTSG